MTLKMNTDTLTAFLNEVFPQVQDQFAIEELCENEICVRMMVQEQNLRPGGTVSGPSMFALADVSAYMIILARIGPKALAVTTNCSIDFMRKPVSGVDLIAKCRLLKLGRALAIVDVLVFSENDDRPVTRASLTYSIPPEK